MMDDGSESGVAVAVAGAPESKQAAASRDQLSDDDARLPAKSHQLTSSGRFLQQPPLTTHRRFARHNQLILLPSAQTRIMMRRTQLLYRLLRTVLPHASRTKGHVRLSR